jgi:hypothetical protein
MPLPAVQLSLEFEPAPTPIRALTPELFLQALRQRRARVDHVRFKKNRTRIIALSKDGGTLHVHACFSEAPDDVLNAVAVFLKAGRRSIAYRDAIQMLRDYWTTHGETNGWLHEDDAAIIESIRRLSAGGTPEQLLFLREAYARFNLIHFDGRLPETFPIRISQRMASRFGHMRYHTTRGGQRIVLELAVNHVLFQRGHEANLLDTLLHEMTHVEAWLEHGHKAHGAVWIRIAKRVGCEPSACSSKIIRRRRRGAPPLERVPDRSWLPPLRREGAA